MSKTIKPHGDRRAQPPVVVVAGNRERLQYISDNGEYREGDPETLWKELAERQPYYAPTTTRGRVEMRKRIGSPPIVIAAKRGSIRDLVRTCDARHWIGLRGEHGKYKSLLHEDGPRVRRLGITADLEPAARGLFDFVEFLQSHGVRFSGSVAGSVFSLFRSTLERDLKLWAPPMALEALWPGRREYWHKPHTWYQMQYYDIKAAYPAALMQAPIPTHWRQIDPDKWRDYPDGFSRASAYVHPSTPPPYPLPLRYRPGTRRTSVGWGSGAFGGVWPNRDLLIADGRDEVVRVTEAWAPTDYTSAFDNPRWRELRAEMRSLPGLAGVLGKMGDNSLWGMFAFDNSSDVEVHWRTADGDMSKTDVYRKGGIRQAHGIGIAISATARVRENLWNGIDRTGAIYCDTDGIIANDRERPHPFGNGDGTWYAKEPLGVVEILAPQCYRWVNEGDVDWHYLGGSNGQHFKTSLANRSMLNGDDAGFAPAMSIRQAHLKQYMSE